MNHIILAILVIAIIAFVVWISTRITLPLDVREQINATNERPEVLEEATRANLPVAQPEAVIKAQVEAGTRSSRSASQVEPVKYDDGTPKG